MNTWLLDRSLWDLVLDSSGNWATATDPYSIEQDVAAAVRTFAGEAYYDTTLGLPYFAKVLGHMPPLSLLKTLISDAALTVPGVAAATVYVSSFQNRQLSGQVQCVLTNGATVNVVF